MPATRHLAVRLASRVFWGTTSGIFGLLGLLLCNGGFLSGNAWVGQAFAIAIASSLAVLGSTLGHEKPDRASAVAVVLVGLAGWLVSGANPNLDGEFGMDRFLLLPLQASLLSIPCAWTASAETFPVCAVAIIVGGGLAVLAGKHRKVLVGTLLGLCMLSFILAATYINPTVFQHTASPPVAKQYVLDSFLFMRVHDLMQQGQSYYSAFFQAYVDRKNEIGTPNTFLHWRPPLIYWLWNVVPGGAHGLIYLYWAMVCLTLLAAYGAARSRLPDGIAIWAPLLLYPYYFYGATTLWFVYQDWWASFFMFYGLYFYSRKSPYLTAFFWSLAAATREHFGYLIVILAVKAIRGSRHERISAAVAMFSVGAIYAIHYWTVRPFISPGSSVLGGWQEAGPGFIWNCLKFGSVYLSQRHLTLVPILLLGLWGALRVGRQRDGWIWPVAVLVPISVFLFIGAAGRYYWGIMMMPQILACVPFATGYWSSAESDGTQCPENKEGLPSADPL